MKRSALGESDDYMVGLIIITLVIIAATFFTSLSSIDANIVTALESLIRIRIVILSTNLELE